MIGADNKSSRRSAIDDANVSGLVMSVAYDSNKNSRGNKNGLTVLIVDDDPVIREFCSEVSREMGCRIEKTGSLVMAEMILSKKKIDVLLLGLKLPDGSVLAFLDKFGSKYSGVTVVVMTAYATMSTADKAIRLGAREYLIKPFAAQELVAVIDRAERRCHFDRESKRLRQKLKTQTDRIGLFGESPEMEKIYRFISKVAFSTHPVLILGESGTGKEIVARAIHFNGPNADKPFVPVDCAALAPGLIESELFGHIEDAFTGADRSGDGLLVSANGGTLFLDEIGELSIEFQAKLLRALQEKEVRPVGATQTRLISARVLAATNRDLLSMVEQGKFRKDLYYRLNVVNMKLPPLRERKADIRILATYFLTKFEKANGPSRKLSSEAMSALVDYDWPGNVRELESTIEHACVLSNSRELQLGDLPVQLHPFARQKNTDIMLSYGSNAKSIDIRHGESRDIVPIAELERDAIVKSIRYLNGDKLLAAKMLGIGKTTLYRKLKEYGVVDFDSDPD